MASLKLLCVSLFVVAALASGFVGSAASPLQVAALPLSDLLR